MLTIRHQNDANGVSIANFEHVIAGWDFTEKPSALLGTEILF